MLQRKVGTIFFVFPCLALVYNLAFTDNPDHDMNVIVEFALTIAFALSIVLCNKCTAVLQVVALIACAYIALSIPDSMFFGASILVFAMILSYAYGDYKSMSLDRITLLILAVYAFMMLSICHFNVPSVEDWFKAGAWTAFVSIFCIVLYFVSEDVDRKYHKQKDLAVLRMNKEAFIESVNAVKLTMMQKGNNEVQDGG